MIGNSRDGVQCTVVIGREGFDGYSGEQGVLWEIDFYYTWSGQSLQPDC